ncbi:hypothetical protein OY671_007712, partial [Metschnikowia pulcherrima]
ELYVRRNFLAADYTVAEARRRIAPFTWLEAKAVRTLSRAEQDIWDTAGEWGWTDGSSVPIHGPGGYFGLVAMAGKERPMPPASRGVSDAGARKDAPVPEPVAASSVGSVGLDVRGHAAEWNDDEVYVASPGPGRDAWVSIDRQTGEVTSERTDRGWVSYFNDSHKGRNSGAGWFWFIDVFAAACVIFTLTGSLSLQLHARHRPSTWPSVALGTAIPLVIALFFIH